MDWLHLDSEGVLYIGVCKSEWCWHEASISELEYNTLIFHTYCLIWKEKAQHHIFFTGSRLQFLCITSVIVSTGNEDMNRSVLLGYQRPRYRCTVDRLAVTFWCLIDVCCLCFTFVLIKLHQIEDVTLDFKIFQNLHYLAI